MVKNIRKPLLIVSLALAIGIVSMVSAYSSFAAAPTPCTTPNGTLGWWVNGQCWPTPGK